MKTYEEMLELAAQFLQGHNEMSDRLAREGFKYAIAAMFDKDYMEVSKDVLAVATS